MGVVCDLAFDSKIGPGAATRKHLEAGRSAASQDRRLAYEVEGKDPMKIKVEVTQADLEDMLCDSLEDFENQFRHQLDNGVVDDEGGAGSDWMSEYQLEIVKV